MDEYGQNYFCIIYSGFLLYLQVFHSSMEAGKKVKQCCNYDISVCFNCVTILGVYRALLVELSGHLCPNTFYGQACQKW